MSILNQPSKFQLFSQYIQENGKIWGEWVSQLGGNMLPLEYLPQDNRVLLIIKILGLHLVKCVTHLFKQTKSCRVALPDVH